MKNLPLAVQIWLVIAGIILSLSLCIAAFLPWILKSFFTYQIFDLLNDSQRSLTVINVEDNGGKGLVEALPGEKIQKVEISSGPILFSKDPISALVKPAVIEQGPLVGHFVYSGEHNLTSSPAIPQDFFQAVIKDADSQRQDVQKYSREIRDNTLFYVIRKEIIQGKPGYMVSYSWGSYRNDLVEAMYWRLMLVMVAVFILSWIPSLWLSRYLTRPLVEMEANIARIAEREWHKPFILDRKDEIGRLARTFENMRIRLVKQDEAQQSFLQNTSHELKTPVMVIRSYANSILDGIYPNETIEKSIEVIDQEALRLEKRIRDLLYLNKLKYLETKTPSHSAFDLSQIITRTIDRFRCRRTDLKWEVNLPVLMIDGSKEQWGVAIENILDNQIRFSSGKIKIDLIDNQNSVILKIFNDGPPIEPEVIGTIFEAFKTGPRGDYGLGLAIVKQIVNHHQGDIWVKAEDGGTAFYIRLNN